MDIRRALNLLSETIEAGVESPRGKYQSLLEAAWKLSYAYASRSWYHPGENRWVKVVGIKNHVQQVMAEPAEFGLTPEELQGATGKDRDPVVMDAACAKGWIRVVSQDRNNPNRCMMFEGNSASAMIKVMRMFWEDTGGELLSAAIKQRTPTGGKEYIMRDKDACAEVCERGKLPAPHVTDRNDSLVQKAA
jgi:hypothetical protein